MRGCLLFVILALVLGTVPCAVGQGYPTEPSASWVYPYLYELRLREPLGPIFVSTGPYGRLETAAWLKGLESDSAEARSLWLYRMLEAEFAGEARVLERGSGWTADLRLESIAETGSPTLGETFGRFAYYSPMGLALWTSLRASVNGGDLHKVATQVWRDRGRASVDYAGIAFRKEGFTVALSRDEVSWGADRRNGLLFSGTAPSFDMMTLSYRRGSIGFTSFHSMLRGSAQDAEEGVRRFVSAHRLEVLPRRGISLGISEAVVYGGRSRTLEPLYMNPLTIFYADQWNSGWNDNILIAGDFALLFPRHADIRGEIVIDDFQYDFGNEPHEFGAGLRLEAVNPLVPCASLVGASYYHIRNQTYGHLIPWNRFIHEGKVMGYEDGPDGDRLALWVTLARPESMLWKADYSHRRKGEGRATDVQEERGPRVDFPSGTVETSHVAGLALAWRPSRMWLLETRVGYHRTRNADNVEGAKEDAWEFSLDVQVDFKIDTWLED
jgi:hypothetical protein